MTFSTVVHELLVATITPLRRWHDWLLVGYWYPFRWGIFVALTEQIVSETNEGRVARNALHLKQALIRSDTFILV